MGTFGEDLFTPEEFEELFKDETEPETPPVNEEAAPASETTESPATEETKVDQTKAFAHRLRESTDKARKEEREAIAKSLGFDSYEALQKSKEKKIFEENGLDEQTVSPVLDQLVKARLDSDPRMAELEELRKEKIKEFGKRELAEIATLTGGEVTTLEQLPREVIDLWKKNGSLKAAYLQLEGEKLITKMRGEQSKGSTAHLANPSGSTAKSNVRPLTAEEKAMYKLFNRNMTDEELNKMTKPIN